MGKRASSSVAAERPVISAANGTGCDRISLPQRPFETQDRTSGIGNPENVGLEGRDLPLKYNAPIRRLARAVWHHPVLDRVWQSAAGRLLRRAAGLPITERTREVTRIEGILVCTDKYQGTIRFFVGNRYDLVQAHHFRGKFYEAEELDIIRRYFKVNGVFVDIGANVCNHTIFASKY